MVRWSLFVAAMCIGGCGGDATPQSCSRLGWTCGVDDLGNRCGLCATGQTCIAGACITPMCTAAAGDACTASTLCCADHGSPTLCARLWGLGQVCSVSCSAGTDCGSGCCVELTTGTHVCSLALNCASATACTAQLGATCTADADCCRDATTNRPSACACVGTNCTCRALCAADADCPTGCCVARAGGVKVCSAPAACGR